MSSDELWEKSLVMLFIILIGIVVILFIAVIHTIFALIFNFYQNGYIDWEHFCNIGRRYHNVVSINEHIRFYWYTIKGFVIIYPIYYLLENFWYIIKYNIFLNQFSMLENVPKRKDIMELLNITEEGTIQKDMLINKFLLPLINLKIQCIEEMNLLQKYSLFYTNNIEGLNIGLLSTYRVSQTEFDKILKNINIPNYISFEIVSSKEKKINILNKNYYKGRTTLMLQMVFNQYAIIKDVILQVFLHDYENNDIKLIKNDVLLQMKLADSDKKKLLINAINENMKENIKFKEKFLESIQK